MYRALPTLDVTPMATTEQNHFTKIRRLDILDKSLIKNITITNEPHAITALDSDHIQVCLDIHHSHIPILVSSLQSTLTTGINVKLLTNTTDSTLQLNGTESIKKLIDVIRANI